ncbi:MAG TPA: hypothetical protein VMT18_15985, partial [Planctomycetota bacterium]|nr:hypothetical protein [Planctomycetota bacterium]
DGEALLVVTEQSHPGWEARADRRGLPLLTVDGVLHGLALRAEDERVTLTYRPRSHRLGWALAAVAAIGLAWYSRRPEGGPEPRGL